jgi:PhzF family phenazine biosynthesis protein
MQAIAREFNLSETVFVLPPEDPANTAKLRIFTPDRELTFAGHPTVGSAILLAELFGINDEVRLEEGVGLVPVAIEQREAGLFAQLSAAVMPEPWTNVPSDKKIAEALGLKPQQIGFGVHRPSVFDPGNHPMLYIPLKDRAALAEATISHYHWPALGAAGAFLAYLYCEGEEGSGVDFHARAYSPGHRYWRGPRDRLGRGRLSRTAVQFRWSVGRHAVVDHCAGRGHGPRQSDRAGSGCKGQGTERHTGRWACGAHKPGNVGRLSQVANRLAPQSGLP